MTINVSLHHNQSHLHNLFSSLLCSLSKTTSGIHTTTVGDKGAATADPHSTTTATTTATHLPTTATTAAAVDDDEQ